MKLVVSGTILTKRIDPNSDYELDNVLAPAGIEYPSQAVTLYYGVASTTQSIAYAFNYSLALHMQLHPVIVEMEVESDKVTCSLEELPTRELLTISKMESDLMSLVKSLCTDFLKQVPGAWARLEQFGQVETQGARKGELKVSGLAEAISMYPFILDQLWNDERFNHLSVIIYTINEDGKMSNRASVFRKGILKYDEDGVLPLITVSGFPEVEIDFPAHIPD